MKRRRLKIKNIIILIVIIIIIINIIKNLIIIFNNGHNVKYKKIEKDNVFSIREIYTQNRKNEKNNYYFTITINDTKFEFQTYKNFSRKKKIIKEIKYFNDDNYECILPILSNNELISDVVCKYKNEYFNYNTIKGNNLELDKFVQKIDEYNIDNNSEKLASLNEVTVYNKLLDNHYLFIQNYKGIYTINKNNKNIIQDNKLFNQDVYKGTLSTLCGKYFMIADYNKVYDFNEINVIDITSNKKSTVISDNSISLDSYIQGIVDNDIYLIDRSNKKQYKINIRNNKVLEIGNIKNNIKVYELDKFVSKNIYNALNEELYFNYYQVDNKLNGIEYYKVDKVGNNLSGYYYMYEKKDNSYFVYRSNVQDPSYRIFLFKTNDIDNIIYNDDYIYYKDDIYIKYYHDETGEQIVIKNSELEFNSYLKFGLYIKK